MSEEKNAELWEDVTEKSYDPAKLPEVENEYDEGDAVDGIIKSIKKVVGLKKSDTTTDAQPPSSSKTTKPSSASSTYTKREYDWKKVEQSKKKIFLIFGIESFDNSCVWINEDGTPTGTVVNKR